MVLNLTCHLHLLGLLLIVIFCLIELVYTKILTNLKKSMFNLNHYFLHYIFPVTC